MRTRRHAVVDVVWGAGFALVAVESLLLARVQGEGNAARGVLVAVLTAVWGLRLSVHIARRNRGKGEDRGTPRSRTAQPAPAAHMYRRVYLTQTAALWFVSLPVQVAMYQRGPLGRASPWW